MNLQNILSILWEQVFTSILNRFNEVVNLSLCAIHKIIVFVFLPLPTGAMGVRTDDETYPAHHQGQDQLVVIEAQTTC